MPKSERDEVISKLTSMVFSAMINDLVMDAALQAHYEAQKLSVLCDICHTHCGTAHASTSGGPTDSSSRPPSPSMEGKQSTPTGSTSGASTSPTNGKPDGAIYFECLNCKRQIASNRYAPHLSSCMGVGNGNRRGGSRNPATKSRPGGDQGRSESPYLGSEASDDSKPSTKGKGKVTKKDDGDFSTHGKRPGSPQATPKKPKKAKTTGSPLKNVTDMPPPASKKSSKLRESSITRESSNAPSMDNESRMSVFSPEATPVSPTSSIDGPGASTVRATNGKITQKPTATHTVPSTSAVPSHPSVHDASYMMMEYDDNETGSSTDSDSD